MRRRLIETAAEMLSRREPVTTRGLTQRAGASTMAVYTYFGGMPQLMRAVRQEGFTRLADDLSGVKRTRDGVRDVVALGAAYVSSGLQNPHLYRTMFDTQFDLEEPAAAAGTFDLLVESTARARDQGRFAPSTDPAALATQFWVIGHGMTTLVLSGVLPYEALRDHVPPMTIALFTAAGDREERCRRSVNNGWRQLVVRP